MGGISGQVPRNIPTQTKLLGADTDLIMTDANTTQENEQMGQQTSHINEETSENGAQQLPNTDPEIEETNDWPNQGWNAND